MNKKISWFRCFLILYVLTASTFISYSILRDAIDFKSITKYKYFVSYSYVYKLRDHQFEKGIGNDMFYLKNRIRDIQDICVIEGMLMKRLKKYGIYRVYVPNIIIINYKRMK